jgi:hypothetical protein
LRPLRDVRNSTSIVCPLFIAANAGDEITFALRLVERRYALAVVSRAKQVAPFATEPSIIQKGALLDQLFTNDLLSETRPLRFYDSFDLR